MIHIRKPHKAHVCMHINIHTERGERGIGEKGTGELMDMCSLTTSPDRTDRVFIYAYFIYICYIHI